MVPGKAIAGSFEGESLGLTRGKWTLSDSRHAVHLIGVVLPQTVPVHRSAIDLHGVGQVNDNGIAPVSLDQGTGSDSVNAQRASLVTIRADSTLCDLKANFDLVTGDGHHIV